MYANKTGVSFALRTLYSYLLCFFCDPLGLLLIVLIVLMKPCYGGRLKSLVPGIQYSLYIHGIYMSYNL